MSSRFGRIGLWLLLVLTALLCGLAAARAEPLPPLNAADFQKRVFRGFTFDELSAVTPENFTALADIGATLVRVGLHLQRCADCNAYAIPPAGLETVDRAVALAERHGLYVVLTLVPEKPQGAPYWKRRDLQDSIVAVWQELARRYRGRTALAGFDLINEPKPPGSLQAQSDAFVQLAGRLIEGIRAVDPERMVIFEPAPSGNAHFAFKPLKAPLPYANVLYSAHFYKPEEVTHQGVGGAPAGEPYLGRKSDRDELQRFVEPLRAFARRHKVPVYVGEFSCIRWAPGDSAALWTRDVLELFEAEGWSWTFHAFRGWHGWDHELGPTDPKPASPAEAARLRRGDTAVMTLLRQYLDKR
jgi:hypothetical protein